MLPQEFVVRNDVAEDFLGSDGNSDEGPGSGVEPPAQGSARPATVRSLVLLWSLQVGPDY